MQGSDITEFQKGQYRGDEESRESLKKNLFNDSNVDGRKPLYCSIPKTGFISLDEYEGSTASGQTKKMYRFAHNFDYYKDLPGLTPDTNSKIHSIPASSGGNIINYIEDPDFEYYIVEKDMVWNISCDQGVYTLSTDFISGNNGIQYWKEFEVKPHIYNESSDGLRYDVYEDEELSIFKPIFLNNFTRKYRTQKHSMSEGTIATLQSSTYYSESMASYTRNVYIKDNESTKMTSSYPGYNDYGINSGNYYWLSYCCYIVDAKDDITYSKYATELNFENHKWGYNFKKQSMYSMNSSGKWSDWITTWAGIHDVGSSAGGSIDSWFNREECNFRTYQDNPFYNYNLGLKYPTKNNHTEWPIYENGFLTRYEYGFISYNNIRNPYIVKKDLIINNANYVIPETYIEDDDWYGTFSTKHDVEKCTILPTLMHEHVKPVINPNPAVVKCLDTKCLMP